MSNNQLPSYLKEELARRKWSGRTLAMYAGVSHSTIARAVRGTHIPDTENLRKMAIALEVEETHLLRVAGHVVAPPISEFDPSAAYIAQRLSKLPIEIRESAIETVGAVVDNIYGIISRREASRKARQARLEREKKLANEQANKVASEEANEIVDKETN